MGLLGRQASVGHRVLRSGGSFEFSLFGLHRVIAVLAEIFDPIRRAERKEKLRHDTAMNTYTEVAAHLDLTDRLNARRSGNEASTPDPLQTAVTRQFVRSVEVLDATGVTVAPLPEDSTP